MKRFDGLSGLTLYRFNASTSQTDILTNHDTSIYRIFVSWRQPLNFLRLLTDPTRLRLILLLEQEELSVAELQDVLGMGQSRISSHLAQLKRAGVVEDRRAGKNVYYGLTNGQQLDPQRARVSELTRVLAREMPETERDRSALKVVLRKRQDKAREYFDQLAGRFGRSYCPGRSWQALCAHDDRAPPAAHGRRSWARARGRLRSCLPKKRAKSSRSITRRRWSSSERNWRSAMVSRISNTAWATSRIRRSKRIGRSRVPESGVASRGSDPERAIAAAHRILKKGGRLVVLDLLSHRFEKARELYADHWLGFSEVQLHQWLEEAGFSGIEVSVVSREKQSPHFQTVLASGIK